MHSSADQTPADRPTHLATVALEDYYQVGAFNELVQRGEWYRFESRLEHGTRRALELLAAHNVRATFFVLGWVAEQFPELVRTVAEAGHEIASKGYYHRHIHQMSPEEFRDDLQRAEGALRASTGRQVLGYRVAGDWLRPEDHWVLDALVANGYRYDSSLAPRMGQYAHEPWRRFAHEHRTADGQLWEFPISSASLFGQALPIGGGNYLRQLPSWLVRGGARRWMSAGRSPFVLYFHTWELDVEQPRIAAARAHQRVRHYRNLDRMESRLSWFLSRWRFGTVAAHLGLEPATVGVPAAASTVAATLEPAAPSTRSDKRTPVTVVVPCHNEELILPYLANTLRSVEQQLESHYRLEFVFVDDGSTDGTLLAMRRLFGDRPHYRIEALAHNGGVAAAITHGIQCASTEIVCSIDCDCTYDPHELLRMIPLLDANTQMVVASPYHPMGAVLNVPRWRLALSHNLSRLYRLVLHNRLHTYTSCFRVYRRSAVAGVRLDRGGFLGVTELLCRLDLAGAQVVEYPATLNVRMLGRSKLRVLRIIGGHLVLLARVALTRLRGRSAWTSPTPR